MAGTEIRSITARQVYTNRGNPGVEAVVTTENGATGRAMCTSGISIGTHEIHFDFDGGERFRGKGVLGAVRNVNEIIAPALKGLDAANQRLIDRTMLDIVPDAKAKLGGNATAAVSAAVLKAGAAALGIPLYRHIGGANAMYLPVPGVAMVAGHERYGGGITTPGGKPTMSVMCFGFDTFADASYACWDIHTRWAEKMDRRFGGAPNIRDFIVVPEGVFKSDEEIWEAMTETIIEAGYEGRAGFQMDVATDTPVSLISAGVGQTPMLAMLDTLAKAKHTAQVNWFHAAENGDVHAFADEVNELGKTLPRFSAHTWYREPTEADRAKGAFDSVGLMDLNKLESAISDPAMQFYLCGPVGFMQFAAKQLVGLGVKNENIHYECFGPHKVL